MKTTDQKCKCSNGNMDFLGFEGLTHSPVEFNGSIFGYVDLDLSMANDESDYAPELIVSMYSVTSDDTAIDDHIAINFCPFCGRQLRKEI